MTFRIVEVLLTIGEAVLTACAAGGILAATIGAVLLVRSVTSSDRRVQLGEWWANDDTEAN